MEKTAAKRQNICETDCLIFYAMNLIGITATTKCLRELAKGEESN